MHTIPGWKTVPVERSYEMRVKALVAFNRVENVEQNRDDALGAAFQAMLAAAPTPPASAQPERDWEICCDHCNGSGHVFVERQVAERKSDVQEFKEECEECEGRGFNIAFEDIPGIAEYVRKSRLGASAQDDALSKLRAPVADEPADASEHYDEVKATLQGAHRIMESLSEIERRVGPVGSHARGYTHKITNALRHLDALYAALASARVAGEVVAWMHAEDPARVVSALQKATSERDGGAYASSLRPYTIALGRLATPQASEAVRDAIKTCGSKIIKALAAIARANGPDTQRGDDPELIYREPVMNEVVRIRQAYDELSAALSAQSGAQKDGGGDGQD